MELAEPESRHICGLGPLSGFPAMKRGKSSLIKEQELVKVAGNNWPVCILREKPSTSTQELWFFSPVFF